MQTISFGKNQLRVVIVCLLALLTLVLFTNATAIHRQLDAWKLLPQPERLTELYYADHTHLPTTYTVGASQQYSFVTHNLEYRDTTYSYTVVQQSEDGKTNQPVSHGSFKLAQNATAKTPVTFMPADLGHRSTIVTTLTNTTTKQQQTIHYWVTNTSQLTPTEGAGA